PRRDRRRGRPRDPGDRGAADARGQGLPAAPARRGPGDRRRGRGHPPARPRRRGEWRRPRRGTEGRGPDPRDRPQRTPGEARRRAAGRRGGDRSATRRSHRIGGEMTAARENLYEVEELLMQPGTYFNPQTEVIVVVDDSASLDQEVFNMEDYEGAEWVRVSDDVPIDEDRRDVALERFQTHYHPGSGGSVSETALEQGDDELDGDETGQD